MYIIAAYACRGRPRLLSAASAVAATIATHATATNHHKNPSRVRLPSSISQIQSREQEQRGESVKAVQDPIPGLAEIGSPLPPSLSPSHTPDLGRLAAPAPPPRRMASDGVSAESVGVHCREGGRRFSGESERE
ncbi:hypothetical protein COCNU_contig69466082G000010 [Cocos nucifera]|nr:hypothetical protein [Cocos nucifera]